MTDLHYIYICSTCGSTMIGHEQMNEPCFNCGNPIQLMRVESDDMISKKLINDLESWSAIKLKELKEMEKPKTPNGIRRELGLPTQNDKTNREQEIQENVAIFEGILQEMLNIYSRKNRDYGNSFDMSLDEDGLLVSKIRLQDKFQRFAQLIKNPAQVKDESIEDTLIDMANYAIMTVKWMRAQPGNVINTLYANNEPILETVCPTCGLDLDGDK